MKMVRGTSEPLCRIQDAVMSSSHAQKLTCSVHKKGEIHVLLQVFSNTLLQI